MEPMLLPFRRYADFTDRSSRSEFWLFVLFLAVASSALTVVDTALGLGGHIDRVWSTSGGGVYAGTNWTGGLLTALFWLTTLIPSLAVSIRRLHDTNHSGWWLLLMFAPVFGWLALLIFYVQRSWPLPNRWGAPAALIP